MRQKKRQKTFSASNSLQEADKQFPQKVEGGGILYVVATPIGNLEDITQRAVRVLQEVDCVAAEDTRQTRKLLSHLDIHKKIISYYKHREAVKAQEIIRRMEQGENIALVADAGTPCVSDPGALLVRKARDRGFRVIPIPGVSALTAVFSVSGAEGPFSFHGFLPGRAAQRKKILDSLRSRDETLVFYESPRRILSFLDEIQNALGNRGLFVARELTKVHEEIFRGPVSEVRNVLLRREKLLGEFVVVVLPTGETHDSPAVSEERISELLLKLRQGGRTSMRDAVALVSQELDLPRSLVYRQGIALWKKDAP